MLHLEDQAWAKCDRVISRRAALPVVSIRSHTAGAPTGYLATASYI
jgi:hypothetical protein